MNDKYIKAYLAGVMDSDGWFTITFNSGRTDCVRPIAGLAMTDPVVLRLLKKQYGGSIHENQGNDGYHQKPLYKLLIAGHSLNSHSGRRRKSA